MPGISALINARLLSTRLPRKLLLPFNGTTLIDIALKKLDKMEFFDNRYFAAAEEDLLERAVKYKNIQILKRDPLSVRPGYGDHKKIYEHYKLVKTKYLMWINPCHPYYRLKLLKMPLLNFRNLITTVIHLL